MVRAISEVESEIFGICDYAVMLVHHALALDAENILELGVGQGLSTQVLARACRQTGGHLYSVDIIDCPQARESIAKLELEKHWTFTVMDDLEFAKTWNKPIDLLFIDSIHTFDHTLAELNLYSKFMKPNGVILMHDTVNREYHGVMEAIVTFLKDNPEWQFTELLSHTLDGLGKLNKKE